MFANIEDITLLCGDAKLLYKSGKMGVASVLPKVSSAGKEPFIAGKVKNMHQRCTFLWGRRQDGGNGVRDMHHPRRPGTTFFETPFPHFKTSFVHIGHC